MCAIVILATAVCSNHIHLLTPSEYGAVARLLEQLQNPSLSSTNIINSVCLYSEGNMLTVRRRKRKRQKEEEIKKVEE